MSNRLYFFLFILLVLVTRTFQLYQVEYANGWDGTYFQMQLHFFQETGQLHSTDYSLIYLPLIALVQITTPLTAYKVTAILCSSCFSICLFFLIRQWSNEKRGYIIGTLSLLSPHLLFFSHQFSKNLLGLSVVFLFFIFTSRKKILIQILLLVIALFAHRFSFALCILIFAITSFKEQTRTNKTMILVGVFVLVSFGVPGLSNWYDLSRITDELQFNFHWVPLKFFDLFHLFSLSSFDWALELISIHTLLIFFIINYKKLEVQKKLLFIISTLLLLPIFNFETGSLGYRFYLISAVFFIPLLCHIPLEKISVKIIYPLLLILLPFTSRSYLTEHFDPPVSRFENLSKKLSPLIPEQPSSVLIIAHKGIKEQIILNTSYNALNWLPTTKDPSKKYYRIASSIDPELLIKFHKAISINHFKPLPYNYWLVEENTWQTFIQFLKDTESKKELIRIQTWQNPSEKRPHFLRQK